MQLKSVVKGARLLVRSHLSSASLNGGSRVHGLASQQPSTGCVESLRLHGAVGINKWLACEQLD
jgi:hypothetical protein